MSTVPPIVPSDPAPSGYSDERPRPRYGEYAPPGAAPFVPPVAEEGFVPAAEVFHNPPPAKPKAVGVTAFIASLALLVLSLVLSVLGGLAVAPLAAVAITGSGTVDQAALESADPDQLATFGVLSMLFFGLGSALALWAIIQGIVAIVKKRGRPFGIAAVAISVATPILCLVLFYVIAFASNPELLNIAS